MKHHALKKALPPTLCCLTALVAGCTGPRDLSPRWEDAGGPVACDVSAMLPDESSPGTVYAGLTTGALYRSDDRGRTWTHIGSIPDGASVNGLVQDPENSARLVAATTAGLYLSADRGATWRNLQVGGESEIAILSVAIDPWKPSTLLAGTRRRGIFRSADGGGSWSQIVSEADSAFSFSDVYDIEIDLQRPDVLYAALGGLGLMQSTDGGLIWARLTPEVSPTASAITHVLVRRTAGNEILYGTAAGAIFRTTDRGTTWTTARHGLDADRIISLDSFQKSSGLVYAGTMNGVIRSADFGITWNPADAKLPRVLVSVALPRSVNNPTIYLFGEGLGVLASSDSAASWSSAQDGLGGSTVSRIVTDRSGDRVYAAVGTTILRRDAASGSWVPAGSGLTGGRVQAFALDADSTASMYAATPAGVYRTTDGGGSWRATPRRLSTPPVFLDTHPMIGTRIFSAGEQGLFVSTDRGTSWGQVKPLGSRFSVRSMTFAPANAGIIFGAGTTGIVTTTDGGITWVATRYGLGGEETIAVTLGSEDALLCYAWTTRGEAFRSTNRGLEWAPSPTPWPKSSRFMIAFDRDVPSDAIALVEGSKLYHSIDGGGTWTAVEGGDIPFEITALDWNASTMTLMAGARGAGVKILRLSAFLNSPQSARN